MNKKLLVLATVLAVGALVGCGKKKTTSSQASVESVVSESAAATSAQASAAATTAAVATDAVAKAVDAALALADKTFSSTEYTLTGYVVGEVTVNTKYNSYTFNLGDTATSTKVLKVYSAELATGINAPVAGSIVTVKGYLENFGGTAEMAGYKANNVAFPKITACNATGSSGGNTTTSSAAATSQASSAIVSANGFKVGMMSDANAATFLGLDKSIVSITEVAAVHSKDGTDYDPNYAGVFANKDKTANELRMYAGAKTNGSLTFTATGKTFATVTIVAETGSSTCNGKTLYAPKVTVGGNVVTATNNVYTINAASFTIAVDGAGTSGQVHITELTVTYAA